MIWVPCRYHARATCNAYLQIRNLISFRSTSSCRFGMLFPSRENGRDASCARLHHIRDPLTIAGICRKSWLLYTHKHAAHTVPFQHETISHNPQGDCTVLLLWRLATPARYGVILRYSERTRESNIGGGWRGGGWDEKVRMGGMYRRGGRRCLEMGVVTCSLWQTRRFSMFRRHSINQPTSVHSALLSTEAAVSLAQACRSSLMPPAGLSQTLPQKTKAYSSPTARL